MTEFEKDKIEVNKLIQQMNASGGDKCLLQAIYCAINLKDMFKHSYRKNRLKQTRYSSVPENKLYSLFNSKIFNLLSDDNKEQLFQEVYNRQIDKNKLERKYICTVEDLGNLTTSACISNNTNNIIINKKMIDYVLSMDSSKGKINKYNVGSMFLFTILHETQHNIQAEKIVNLLLNKGKDEHEDAMSAMSILLMSMPIICNATNNVKLAFHLRNDYRYFPDEHDANYAATVTMNNAMKMNKINDIHFIESLHKSAMMSLYMNDFSFESETYKMEIRKRAVAMQNVMEKYLHFAKLNFVHSPIKDIILGTIEDYLKLDEKGNSKFKDKMTKDMEVMSKVVKECIAKEKKIKNSYYGNIS